MNKIKMVILALAASCLAVTGANAQGLIGQPYFGVDGGWERFDNGTSDDGWGVGAELNAPFALGPQAQFGTDLRFRGNYKDVLDRDIWDVEALLRAHMLPMEGLTPYVGVGFGWVDFDPVDSTYLPLEVGFEAMLGPMSILPYFRYSFAFDSAVGDFWTAGAQAVYWFPATGWGLTAAFDYTDYDDIGGLEGVDNGIGVRLGLVFSY